VTALNDVKRRIMGKGDLYTPEELMVRLKFIIGICLTLTLMGIIFTILYSVIFVTQPLKAIAPIDQKFFEVIIPVASFLCGILSGIMLNSSNAQALDAVQKTMATFKDTSAQAGKLPEGLSASVSAPAPKAAAGRVEPVLDPGAEVVPVTTGFKGKLAPPPAPQPEIE
jgi:hypothetical protein